MAALLFAGAALLFAGTAPSKEYIGDEGDGSRAQPVHLIPVLDEEGIAITAQDEFPVPFSVKQTCAMECHQYERITQGWHFNAAIESATPGRKGHPWLFVDEETGTLIPLSYRGWPGTYTPADIGLDDWEFIKRFGRHWPGGGVGEWGSLNDSALVMRQMVSGPLEANCLACHNAHPGQDQAEYALQIARENFRWAAAAASGLAHVEGSAKDMDDTYDYLMPEPPDDPKLIEPGIAYQTHRFDSNNKVLFEIQGEAPNHRCYYCHTTVETESHGGAHFAADDDVHLAAGMDCVDCHRNDADHDIVRGYKGEAAYSANPLAEAMTCEGCHLGDHENGAPGSGRFAAPRPLHKGIPPLHFESMTCTACHSGPWPEAQAQLMKTSMAHGLGMHGADKSPDALPHVYSPLYADDEFDRIAPHYAVWPSFFARKTEDGIIPITMAEARHWTNPQRTNDIENFEEKIKTKLFGLGLRSDSPGPWVYVGNGFVYSRNDTGEGLNREIDEAAQPYLWPIAHNVRPAAQSLGVRGCDDCHSPDAAFFFTELPRESLIAATDEPPIKSIAFMNIDPGYTAMFNLSFTMRPWFKILTSIAAGLLALIALAFIVRMIQRGMDWAAKQ